MREIDLKASLLTEMPIFTFMTYGDTRSGKTTFSGTFPRPLVLADITEKGYEALRDENWNNEVTPRFEEGIAPIVWGIEKESDLAEAIPKIEPMVKAGLVKTIVVSSISFYSDLVFNSILMRQEKTDTRKAYGDLGTHLRNVRIKIHGLGVNVVWEALTKHPETDDPIGRPMIPGQQADKFAAGVDFIFYTKLDQPQPTKPATFDIYTRRHNNYIAGNRLGSRASLLPNPLRGTYATMLSSLGYDVDAIRKALPPIASIQMVKPVLTSAAKPAAPPIKIAQPSSIKITQSSSPAVKSAVSK